MLLRMQVPPKMASLLPRYLPPWLRSKRRVEQASICTCSSTMVLSLFALTNTVEDFGIVGLESTFAILHIMFALSKPIFIYLFFFLGMHKKKLGSGGSS